MFLSEQETRVLQGLGSKEKNYSPSSSLKDFFISGETLSGSTGAPSFRFILKFEFVCIDSNDETVNLGLVCAGLTPFEANPERELANKVSSTSESVSTAGASLTALPLVFSFTTFDLMSKTLTF